MTSNFILSNYDHTVNLVTTNGSGGKKYRLLYRNSFYKKNKEHNGEHFIIETK